MDDDLFTSLASTSAKALPDVHVEGEDGKRYFTGHIVVALILLLIIIVCICICRHCFVRKKGKPEQPDETNGKDVQIIVIPNKDEAVENANSKANNLGRESMQGEINVVQPAGVQNRRPALDGRIEEIKSHEV